VLTRWSPSRDIQDNGGIPLERDFVARMAFWIGYRIDPLYRAFGMGATGYLNVGLLAFAMWKAVGLEP
jgi:hypothetical protein